MEVAHLHSPWHWSLRLEAKTISNSTSSGIYVLNVPRYIRYTRSSGWNSVSPNKDCWDTRVEAIGQWPAIAFAIELLAKRPPFPPCQPPKARIFWRKQNTKKKQKDPAEPEIHSTFCKLVFNPQRPQKQHPPTTTYYTHKESRFQSEFVIVKLSTRTWAPLDGLKLADSAQLKSWSRVKRYKSQTECRERQKLGLYSEKMPQMPLPLVFLYRIQNWIGLNWIGWHLA